MMLVYVYNSPLIDKCTQQAPSICTKTDPGEITQLTSIGFASLALGFFIGLRFRIASGKSIGTLSTAIQVTKILNSS
jgi:hypothetical protein